jgi:pimeloyl-ACP methyl ester carboxylesterase
MAQRHQRGWLKKEKRAQGETWVLFFRTTRKSYGKRVENKIPVGLVRHLPDASSACESIRPKAHTTIKGYERVLRNRLLPRDIRGQLVDDDPRRFGFHNLRHSSIPVTVAWGIHDVAAPVRVADYAWKTALESRTAPADFWLMPCGNHYIQHDQPGELARVVRLELTGKLPAAPANLSSDRCSAVLVARQNGEGKNE